MEDCELCGEEDRLFEAVTGEGVKSLCRRCLRVNNYPIIERANAEQMRNEHRFSGNKEATPIPPKKKSPDLEKLDEELENIVLSKVNLRDYDDLVDNFHWHLQKARRMKKISQKQLGDQIAEPEVIIASAERGELPSDYDKLISKLEQFLHVTIRKNPKRVDGFSRGEFDIKKADWSSVRTGDLRKVEEREIKTLDEDDEIEIISFEDD
jgi:ribosome-binding protein aMBF1 (putative translation factor)